MLSVTAASLESAEHDRGRANGTGWLDRFRCVANGRMRFVSGAWRTPGIKPICSRSLLFVADWPAQSGDQADHQARGGQAERDRIAGALGDGAPDGAADSQTALEGN